MLCLMCIYDSVFGLALRLFSSVQEERLGEAGVVSADSGLEVIQVLRIYAAAMTAMKSVFAAEHQHPVPRQPAPY